MWVQQQTLDLVEVVRRRVKGPKSKSEEFVPVDSVKLPVDSIDLR